LKKKKTLKAKSSKPNKYLERFNKARNYQKDRTNYNNPGMMEIDDPQSKKKKK